MARTTRLQDVLNLLAVNKKELAKRLGVSQPRLQQLLTNKSLKQKDEHLSIARSYIMEIAANAMGMDLEKGKGDGIESLRSKYEEKYGKPVSMRYKNDSEWIRSKL